MGVWRVRDQARIFDEKEATYYSLQNRRGIQNPFTWDIESSQRLDVKKQLPAHLELRTPTKNA